MSKLETFTSTGSKIIPKLIECPELIRIPRPLSLQVALTEKCNLKCAFCSVAKRSRKFEFDHSELIQATQKFINMGIKTIEITGGGEPLQYPRLADYIYFCKSQDLKIGLITNGIDITEILGSDVLNKLSWLRISMNCLDYVEKIDIPNNDTFPGTLGFSYCFGPDSSEEKLKKVIDIAKENNVRYVRVVPNCLATSEELKQQHLKLSEMVAKLGEPAFYQQKEFGRPNTCYWGYYKPFLYCDGYVFPCSSVVLNDAADRSFSKKFRVCHWRDIERVWTSDGVSRCEHGMINPEGCNHCVFEAQNNLLESLRSYNQPHKDFI